MPEPKHKHTILYAEDDADDLYMVRQAFERFDGTTQLLHVPDGLQALQQLKMAAKEGPLPCLVILDINMPGMDGRETLMHIRQHPVLKDLPAVLFTTSSSDADRKFAEEWNAKFITKPLLYSELQELAHTFLNLCSSSVSAKAHH
jgi:CheY-like chemotaxis protein